jgi:hypothetical protein
MSKTHVFRQKLSRLQPIPAEPAPSPGSKKRDNIFSRSRDLREDRDERQMKTSDSQTFAHGQ